MLNKRDIIISARGTVGAMAMLEVPMTFNQSCYGLRFKHPLYSQDYLFYLVKNSINELMQISHGGVFDTITKATFDEVTVYLPEDETEQQAIAEVLSSLDDKIDLLHRNNKTLEEMAETLFRQRFVEGAKEDWEDTNLLSCITLTGGGTPKTSNVEYWNGDIPWLSCGDIAKCHKSFITNSEKSITKKGLSNSSAKLLPKFSTVITARGTVGKYSLLSKPMAFSQSNYGILPKIEGSYFYTYLLVASSVEALNSSAYGSVFDTITTSTFLGVTVQQPPSIVVLNFEKLVTPVFEKILNNSNHIQNLIKVRDSLLPKLMSGQVRVNI
jgi:type I restriction enzyme S subunit